MKFLLDVGITPALGRLLEKDGHHYRYFPDHYSNNTLDEGILDIARHNDEVVITHDLDFGTLLAFSGQKKPSVILFRIHHINARIFHQLISEHWNNIVAPLSDGSLIVIEDFGVRIRKLPIK